MALNSGDDLASDPFNKAKVLEVHAANMAKSVNKKADSHGRKLLSQPAAPALHKLQVIGIKDLKVGKHHTGCALYGALCADAFKSDGIHSVLEDAEGRAVLLSVYNLALSTTTSAGVKDTFPNGLKVAIKEPFFKREKAGNLVVRVDNLLNIEKALVLPDADGRFPAFVPDYLNAIDPVSLRLEGNQRFASKDWTGAIESYSKCIATCFAGTPSSDLRNVAAIALSNRAEAWINLGNYEQAVSDSNKSLKINSSNLKTLCRKARALHDLHEYEQAHVCFTVASDMSPGDVGGLMKQNELSIKQSKHGQYDITEFLVSGLKREKAPRCADYVGPVAIRKAGNMDRGLFATKDVKAGGLLLVSNALAVAYSDTATSLALQEDLVTKIMTVLVNSRRVLEQLNSLSGSFSSAKALVVPSLDLFKPNSGWYSDSFEQESDDQNLQVDTESVRKIVKENGFGDFLSYSYEKMCKNADVAMTSKSWGLWVLPSFINHSCLSNASRLEVGRAMFIHAARDIQAGEEITLPYFDTLVPLHKRQEMCQRWGFQCQCRRCSFERPLQKALKKIAEEFDGLHANAVKDVNAAAAAGEEFPAELPACSDFAQLAVKLEKKLTYMPGSSAASTMWLQASYVLAYLAGFASAEFFEVSMTEIPPGDDIRQAMQAAVPGHWRTLALQSGELIGLRQYMEPESWEKGIMLMATQQTYALCEGCFGKQKLEVYNALISHFSKMRPF